jgi:tetratricopeptide (TPR) repeat protein
MQDLSVSQLSVERVRVSVLDEKDFFAALSAGRSEAGFGQDYSQDYSQDSGQTQSAGQVQTGDSLFAAKKYPEAYAAYLRNYVPGNPAMENRLAELAMSLGLYAEAVGHWLKLIDSKEGDWARLALRGIFDASLAGRLEDSLISSAERLSSIEGSFSKGDLVATVNALREKKDFRKAVQFCESFIARYPFIKGIDEVYWLLGNLYEEPGALRSEEKAVSYYRIVTDNYPASLFWQRAKDRVLYIERNYLFIR